ncbi:MAG: protein kinase, partial [Myxococcales bacterium]|nr:protein kinase [Myxococcales bacterium]
MPDLLTADRLLLDRYRVGAPLGKGGMGVVFGGTDTRWDLPVAIKVPRGRAATDRALWGRFAQEAATWQSLQHPRILRVLDIVDDDSTDYRPAVVMPHCDGGDLAAWMGRGAPPLPAAARVGSQVAEALSFVHGQGLVHRDVKPANVLRSAEGDALLSDFGLVRALPSTPIAAAGGSPAATAMTGTPAYMAPEQFDGAASPRTDVYALGVLLFELLCGARPIRADARAGVAGWAYAHRHAAILEPESLRADLPADLADLLRRCLSKDEDRRPGLSEIQATLDRHAEPDGDPAPPRQSREMDPRALLRLGEAEVRRGRLEFARRCFEQAREALADLGDVQGVAASDFCLAGLAERRGEWSRAEAHYLAARTPLLEYGQAHDAACCDQGLAALCKKRGDLEAAQAHYHRALETDTSERSKAISLAGLGGLLSARGRHDRARIVLESALQVFDAGHDRRASSQCRADLAIVTWRLARHSDAIELFQRCARECTAIDDRHGMAHAYHGWGCVLADLGGDLAEAAERMGQALSIRTAAGNRSGCAESHYNLGVVALHRGDLGRAERDLQAGLALYLELGEPVGAANCEHNLGKL